MNKKKLKKSRLTVFLTISLLLMVASQNVVFVKAASPIVEISDGHIDTIGSTTEVSITLNEAKEGLSGYNLTVSLSNATVAEIVSASFPPWAYLNDNSIFPADSVWIKAIDLTDQIKSGATDTKLATLEIRGDNVGTTDIVVTVTQIDDDGGYPINPFTESGSISVGNVVDNVPNVALTINETTFGNIAAGASKTLDPSFTLENQGTSDVKVHAYFTSNFSGIHGMVSDANVIGGSNFTISGISLTDDGTVTNIDPLLFMGELTKYNATLKIPEDQKSGAYLGVVEIIYEEIEI